MVKLINSNKWNKNDIRMIIVMLLISVYPILAGSLFMMFVFFIMPYQTAGIWPHLYWLIATAAWLLLLALILPLLKDDDDERFDLELRGRKERGFAIELQNKPFETTSNIKPLASDLKVEKVKEFPEKKNSMEIYETSMKETINEQCINEIDERKKSQEIVKRSHGSLNDSHVNLRGSWGFPNSYLESLEKETSTEVVHADRKSKMVRDNEDLKKEYVDEINEGERKSKDLEENNIVQEYHDTVDDESKMQNRKINDDWNAGEHEHIIKDQINNYKNVNENAIINGPLLSTNDPCESKSTRKDQVVCLFQPNVEDTKEAQVIGIIEPDVEDGEKTIEVHELEEAVEEVADLEIVSLRGVQGNRSVDRSRASGYIENHIPWSANRTEKNAVFLFIK